MGFTKFVVIFILALVMTLGMVYYREWRISSLEEVYNYNFKDFTFWKAFFVLEHSAGQVYMWRNYPNLVNFYTFFGSMLIIYVITLKWEDG